MRLKLTNMRITPKGMATSALVTWQQEDSGPDEIIFSPTICSLIRDSDLSFNECSATVIAEVAKMLPPKYKIDSDGFGYFDIQTPQDVVNLLRYGHDEFGPEGDVFVKWSSGGLVLFNYTPSAQYRKRWRPFERMSRGLIIDWRNCEIIARPFDKFFNYGEEELPKSSIHYVMEKMDGSLGIIYWFNGKIRMATRGSFSSIQSWVGEEMLRSLNHQLLDRDYTYLVEIIYPDNRIVVNYGEERALYLLAARHKESGRYMPHTDLFKTAFEVGFKTPRMYPADTLEDLLALKEKYSDREGIVAVFNDGSRVKFKANWYVEMHKLVFGLTFNKVRDALIAGTSSEDILSPLPDEFFDTVNTWINDIMWTVSQVEQRLFDIFEKAPKETRKDFAQWVMANHKKDSAYLFAMFDGKPIRQMIMKNEEFKEYKEQSTDTNPASE